MSQHLFSNQMQIKPLAAQFRPRTLEEFIGQSHLFGQNGLIRRLLDAKKIPSMVFWGPPGTGKTTAAQIVCKSLFGELESLSAVSCSVKDIREAALRAEKRIEISQKKTYLFLDEIHRFTRSQQDALLGYVENGLLTLIAATTENPSFYVNQALLSRCRVFRFNPLSDSDLSDLLKRVLQDSERGLGSYSLELTSEAADALVHHSGGDARSMLVSLQILADLSDSQNELIDLKRLGSVLEKQAYAYDKKGEAHYDVISAFIKSLRGSDPHAAVHYLARMLESGEDPRFIARRMVIFASEDVGNADPQAIQVAVSAMQSFEWTGMPEGYLPLTQAATYLASAPKSNAVITAYIKAKKDLENERVIEVPSQLKNASSRLSSELGHGAGYKYPHDFEGNFIQQEYLPSGLKGRKYYFPTRNGYEKFISDRLQKLGMLPND